MKILYINKGYNFEFFSSDLVCLMRKLNINK